MRSPLLNPTNLSPGSYYKVNLGTEGQIIGITEISSAIEIEPNSSCDSSDFFIDVDGPDSAGIFCNQITVEHINPLDSNSDYLIKSIGVYKIRDGYIRTESIGFKNRTQI